MGWISGPKEERQMKRIRGALNLLLLVAAVNGAGLAQQNAGTLKGNVKDSSGLAIVGATVTARNSTTGVVTTTATNDAGAYVLSNLPIGEYTLNIRMEGFKVFTVAGIRLVAGQELAFDATLAIGSIAQVVTVTGAALQLDTNTSTMGATATSEEIHDLPLQMQSQARSAQSFLTTLSSISYNPAGGVSAFNSAIIEGSGGYGGNGDFAGYTVDGQNGAYKTFQPVADLAGPLPETVQEVRLASNFNADAGWDNAVEVAIVTKSGTNSFHGSAYEYVQNTDLDSRNWFSKTRAPDHQNEFGFTMGGPIKKNKVFFFGALDFFRYNVSPNGVVATVPTAAMRTGDFSAALGSQIGTDELGRPIYSGEIYDPTTTRQQPDGSYIRDPFDYGGVLNVIPPNEISSVSKAFQQGYPMPNLTGLQNNWDGSKYPSPLSLDRFSIKIDEQIGEKYRLTYGMDADPIYDPVSGATAFGAQLDTTTSNPQSEWRPRFSFTATLRPNLIFTLNLGAGYVASRWQMDDKVAASESATAGLKGIFTPNIPIVNIQNATGFGTTYYAFRNPQFTVPIIGTYMSWVRGSHSIRFGADMMQSSLADSGLDEYTSGDLNFQSRTTGFPNNNNTGSGYAAFLLGQVDNASLSTPLNKHMAGRGWDAYIEDQWRATHKLTLNYGLRWAASQGPWEVNNEYGAFSPTVPNPAAGGILGALTFWGTGAGRNGLHYLIAPSYAMFEPRLGIAYEVLPKTVLRMYYGLFDTPNFATFNEGGNAPFYGVAATVTPTTPNAGLTPAFEWDNGFPQTPTPYDRNPSLLNGSGVMTVEPNNNHHGRTQAFGVSVERSLPWGLLARGRYIAKLTHGLDLPPGAYFYPNNVGGFPEDQLNPQYLSMGNLLLDSISSPQAMAAGIKSPYPGFTGDVAQALLPFPQYTYIGDINNTGVYTEYNAGNFALQKHFGNGASFLIDYTVSKMLLSGFYQDYEMNTRKMLSNYDRPQSLAVSYDYELPFGPGKHFLSGAHGTLRQLVGGWDLAGIQNYFSGYPINITTQATIPGITFVEAVLNQGTPIAATGCSNYNPNNPSSRYLNLNAFSTPAPFTLGNLYTLPGVRQCGYQNENVSLSKSFQIAEGKRLKLSGNFFNLLNRHDWSGLASNINNSTTFGTYSSATAPRIIQLSGTIEF
jgi:hypothetical protein